MAFVDDDEEEDFVPQSASKYYFEDDDKEPVSFAGMPIQWGVKDKVDESATVLYLRGTSGDGLLPLHKSVKAWKFDLSNFKPEISVLTKDNIWIKLQKPRKSYEELIRTVLVTLHSLQFLRRNPNASDKSLWEQLSRTFGSHDVRPSQNDLVDHIDLIAEAVKRDVNLAKSKFLLAFLAKKPTKKRLPDEDNPRDAISKFIVGDDMSVGADENDMDDDDDDDYFESVCAICDNGGNLLCCEGSCLRSFHATKGDGEDSFCESLGLKKKQVEEIQSYFCGNCEHKIHQCFICEKLGSSDNSVGAEVFQCVSATCGYFYHPRCVARQLHLGNKAEAKAQEERIIAGESFTCPLHKCCVCTKGEVKTDTNLQFAVCRRCPKSYHRKCLPREISFGDTEDVDIYTRAWDGLLHNRVLIYCLDHEIDEELMTPIRDHLKFPFTEEKVVMKEQSKILESHVGKDKARPKVNDLAVRDSCEKGSVKSCKRPFPPSKDGASTKKYRVDLPVPDSLRKQKEVDPSRKFILVRKKFQKNTEFEESCEADKNKVKVNETRDVAKNKVELKEACKADNKKASRSERVYNDLLESDLERPGLAVPVDSKHHKTDSIAPRERRYEVPTLDNDSERRLLAVMEKATEEITMNTMLKKYQVTSTHHTSSLKNLVDKTITMGKVEGSVQAVRTALKKLEDGENIEDAKAVCEPEVLSQIFKWKEKLRVYLAPFIHGARYTSYGRHFTKVDKLQQIVDRLHWYAEDGDTIVDFCCGANDFSWLMKLKLEETGKKCLYKNYDLIQAKNDFNFEMRDWLTVRKEELATGSKLIMGLNPPFGVNAALANKFIRKALEFQPKILILIVPVETERLDKSRYVLIWEDEMFLSGKSFYLPGSVDEEEKQMEDWNIVSPPLALWSRSDFAAKHREIAKKHCHLSREVGSSKLKENNEVINASLHPLGASVDICDGNTMLIDSPLENVEHCAMENEDVPMEIDEPELAESVDRNVISETIKSPKTATYEKHQSHPSPERRRLKKVANKKDYSGKVLGKSVGTSNEAWKNKDVQEDPVELSRGPESSGTQIPERTSGRQSPLQSDRDDIYDVCAPLSNSIVRFQESVEVSPTRMARTRSNWEEDVREPDSTVRNRPSFVTSSREDAYTVRPSPANAGQTPHEALEVSNAEASISHFNDDLAAKYGFGGGYRMPDPPCMPDQFPLAPSPRDDPNEMFNYRSYSGVDTRTQFHQYGQANVGSDSRDYLRRYGGHLDPMSAPPPPPPHMMDNNPFPIQRYPLRFDELNYQRMDSLPPPPPLQPNGNGFYASPGLPPPPPPADFRSAHFAPGLDYHYHRGGPTGSAGWLNE